jgi:hypothetical protein
MKIKGRQASSAGEDRREKLLSKRSHEIYLVQAGRNNPPVKLFPLPPLLPLLPLLLLLSALVENFCRTGLVPNP